MANLFEIALANPIRFINANLIDNDRYFYQPFDIHQDKKCYFQKFTTQDTTKLQILSDFDSITFNIYRLDDNSLALNVVPVQVPINIIDQTFKAYEITIPFTSLPEGDYYCKIAYVNELLQTVEFVSEPISVLDVHPNTLLIEYTNSENNFSVVFDTGIVFSLRVEGIIEDFTPEFDDVIYNDQKRNATKLNSIPYRSFRLYVGPAAGIPDWMADKVNRALSCDQVMLDGEYYEKVEGAKWEVKRADEYEFIGMTLEIMPVDNFFLQRLKTGDQPGEGYIPVQKVTNYFDNGADIAMSNIFRKYTLLEKICIIRNGGTFMLKVGTTPGGSEIGEFEITDLITTININWLFSEIATVYLSGLDATNNDISIIYKQLDEDPIGAGSPNPYKELGIGAIVIYEEIADGGLEADFNLGTGLGNISTQWEGWAICDGRNGTVNRGGVFPIGWLDGDANYGTIGATGGSSQVTLTQANMPNYDLHIKDGIPRNLTAGGNGNPNRNSLQGPPDRGELLVSSGGSDEPFSIIPPYIVSFYVKKISNVG